MKTSVMVSSPFRRRAPVILFNAELPLILLPAPSPRHHREKITRGTALPYTKASRVARPLSPLAGDRVRERGDHGKAGAAKASERFRSQFHHGIGAGLDAGLAQRRLRHDALHGRCCGNELVLQTILGGVAGGKTRPAGPRHLRSPVA